MSQFLAILMCVFIGKVEALKVSDVGSELESIASPFAPSPDLLAQNRMRFGRVKTNYKSIIAAEKARAKDRKARAEAKKARPKGKKARAEAKKALAEAKKAKYRMRKSLEYNYPSAEKVTAPEVVEKEGGMRASNLLLYIDEELSPEMLFEPPSLYSEEELIEKWQSRLSSATVKPPPALKTKMPEENLELLCEH
jgi:hypothetical protein